MAYRALGSDYASNNQPSEANSNYTRAYELRERVTEPERLAIESNYYSEVTGQIDEAAQANRRWIDNYPQQVEAIGSLGIIYGMQGKYEEAAEAMRRIGRLQPDQIGRKENLSTFMMALATTLTKRPTSPKKRLRATISYTTTCTRALSSKAIHRACHCSKCGFQNNPVSTLWSFSRLRHRSLCGPSQQGTETDPSLLRSGGLSSARRSLCRGLGSRRFTERLHRNALVRHFQHRQVFCAARRLKDYAVTRRRLHQRAPQR